MNIKEFRAKNPAYDDLSDVDLAKGLHQKLYSDIPFDEFTKKIGLEVEAPQAEAPKPQSFLSQVKDDIVKAITPNSKYKSVVDGMDGKVVDSRPAIERRGAPVTDQTFNKVKSAYENSTVQKREELANRNDWLGSVTSEVDKQYKDVKEDGIGDNRKEAKINKTMQSSKADFQTAKNMVEQGFNENDISTITNAAPQREVVDYALDTVRSIAKVAPTTGKMVADFASLGTNFIPVVGDMVMTFGEGMDAAIQYQTEKQSPELRQKSFEMQEILKSGTSVQLVDFLTANPAVLSDVAIPSLGFMLASGGVGAGATKLATEKATANLTAKYAGRNAEAIKTLASRYGKQKGTQAAIAMNVGVNSGSAFSEAEGDARTKYTAAAIAGLATLAGGKLTKGGAEGVIARGDLGKGLSGVASRVANVAKVAGTEMLQEYTEGGGQALGVQTGERVFGDREEIDFGQIGRQGLLEALAAAGPGGVVGALQSGEPPQEKNNNRLIIDGSSQDEILAAKLQAEYDAKVAESDAALANITNPDISVDEAIALAEKAVDIPASPKGLLGSAMPAEALPASDILEDDILGSENVSADVSGTVGRVDSGAVEDGLNQPSGSAVATSDGINADGSSINRESVASDIPAGTGSTGNDTLDRPFAQATDEFLPKMRSMTVDETVIAKIDEELKLRGITNVDSVNTSQERVDETQKSVQAPTQQLENLKTENSLSANSVLPDSANAQVNNESNAQLSAIEDNAISKDALSSTVESGATAITSENGKPENTAPVVAKQSKPKAPKPTKPKTLLATLSDLGGVKLSDKQDVTGETTKFAPGGYNKVFKQASNRSLKGLIETGDLDDYLPYNMLLESNVANDDAFDSTEAYDYLADKIRNGESVLPYAVVEELQALAYQGDAVNDVADVLTEDEINEQLRQATNEERESATDARVFNTDSENSRAGSGERSAATTQTNASQQAEVDNNSAKKTASIKDAEQDQPLLSDSKDNKSDLLGENTTAKQAIADAERAKDAKRNSGNDNQDTFTLTGSNSEVDQARAAGAQDLFSAPIKQQSNTEASTGADVAENTANQSSNSQAIDEVAKAAEALTAAGVKGKEKLDTIKDVREGKVTADEVADAYGEPATQKPKGNVDDFGEKLEGARKDMVRAMAKEYSDDDLATLPLSKIWPITDVNLIENKTAAAIAWAAREEIPSKPRKPYAVKVWVGKVKILRDIGRLVSNALNSDAESTLQKIKDAQLGQFKSKVALLEAIDRDAWKRIGKVEEYPNAYTFNADGTKTAKPLVRIDIDGNTNSFNASSVADVIDNVNEKLGKEKQEKRMAFEVRGSSKGGYFINKKGDKNYTKLKNFDSSKEAFEFLRNNYDEVVAAWDATKDRLNVKESDVRGKENRPRTGEDYRKGKDVSSEEFATTFGFRGIQFGEWVKQGGKDNDRQGALNAAYDALMDLANIVGVPPKAMSLEGTLGLSFGARGKGSAAAHFEPGNLVINLTKTQGAGTLAHEWFHALDNYFSRKRGGEKSMAEVKSQQAYREGNYITYKPEALYINKNYGNKGITKAELERYRKQSPNSKYWSEENWIIDPKHPQGVRPEVEVRFADLVDALNTSPMKQRARSIDGVKEGTDGYWSRIIELGARAFENYVIHKMQLNGYDNDYLANVVRVDSFNRDSSRFPYLLDEEVAPVAEAFDNLFGEIKTKETDSGNVVMFSRSNVENSPIFYSSLTRAIEEIKTNKADPKLWKGMIKNLAQKGVKPDEVEWTGVNEWLDLQTGAVTKEQVLEYLKGNGVQVEETMLGENERVTLYDRYDFKRENGEWFVYDKEGVLLNDGFKYEGDAIEWAREDFEETVGRDTGGNTKYSQYTVPGGTNYKELLLTLPVKNEFEAHNEAMRQKYGTYAWQGMATKEEKEKGTKLMGGAERTSYKSSHFDQANILAHVRFDERTDSDGNKTLFIQEIQSDYGQEGKKRGFKLTDAEISSMKGYSLAVKIEELNRDWRGDRTSKAEQDKGWAEVEAEKQSKGITDADIKAAKEAIDRNVVALPRAPFVTKTDAWVSLAIKRMMRYAAENGFDKVAFINGQQAADLYDLSKQVDSVSWNPDSNQLEAYNNETVVISREVDRENLPDVIGKEVAKNLLESKARTENGAYLIAGDDLKVGGEGMRTFYNSIVPKVAKDVLKKLGGSVEKSEVSQGKGSIDGMPTLGNVYNEQLTFTITPEMREKIMGGLPLFNREGSISTGLPKQSVQKAVNAILANWKNAPEIIVVQDMNDPAIREAVREENDRQLSQGAKGQPEGFFDNGKVYIVASEMNSVNDIVRVMFHETLGHYGLRGTFGKELGAILDRIAMLRKADMSKKAKQYGLDLSKESDKRIIAEEVLAEMAQTAPKLGFVKSAIAAIRKFLRDIGVKLELTDSDIINDYIIPARSFVVNGANKQQSVSGMVAAFNRDNSPTTAQLFKELTLNDELFKYPKSNAKDMQQVFDDAAKGLVLIEKSKSFDDDVSELYSVYPIDATGKPDRTKVGFINVFEDGKVEINVSKLGEGFGGSRIYAAVGNWAYNNGKVFAGDREGISPAGMSRRLENMISLALKFGTTDHIIPHQDQMDDLGFDWKEGDFEYNLGQMLEASYNAIRNGIYVTDNKGTNYEMTYKSDDAKGLDKLDDLVYDFDKHQFTDLSNGQRYTTADFEKLASTDGARATYAGRTTLQRAAIGHTFMGATSERKKRLLEHISKLGFQSLQLTDPDLNGIFYSRANQAQTETPQFKAWFGDSKVVDADGKPLVVLHGGTASTEFSYRYFNSGSGDGGWLGKGFYFTPDYDYAQSYVDNDENKQLLEVFVTAKKPYIIQNSLENGSYSTSPTKLMNELGAKTAGEVQKILKEQGYDSIILKDYEDEGAGIVEVVAFEPNQIKSSNGNNGNFDPTNPDIRFSRTQSPQGRLNPKWQVDETSKMDNVIRYLQDKFVDLKRVTQEIKESGADISDRWNAYLQEELYHGRTAKRVQDFINQDLKPLIEDMRMRGVGMAEFEEYLWMRHAPERNAQVAKINLDMPDGGAGVTTAEAEAYMEGLNPTDKKKHEALARRIDLINRKSRQVLIDYGIESQATINAMESAYEFYVPLMREDMERGLGNGTGSGFKVKGNSTKRALGSNRAVVDIIANIAQQYEKNIIRGEKNRVATALIGLAKLNPNEEIWQVETPPTIRHVSKATGFVETRTDPNYKNRDNVIVARIVNKRGEIEERSVTFNEFNERAMNMALAMNNLDTDQVSALTNFMGHITRYFSSINTQYNPIFGVVNITRDTQGAMLNLSTTDIAGKQKEVMANVMPAIRGIYADTRSESGIKNPLQFGSFTKAQKAKAQAMRALWEEYQREGGTTGFRDMYANAEARTESLTKALDPQWWTKTLAGKVVTVNGLLTVPETALKEKAIKPIFEWLSDYNQTLENAVRLAAYKVAIDQGLSKQQAASIGKNLTVNFNRKGAATRAMGSWYAFFNAAVQGTARIAETLTGPKGKQIIAGGIGIGVAQAMMLAAMGFDDEEPPEFVRANNFIIPAPGTDKGYVTIPMPLGFNVLPNFGRITTEWALSGAERTTDRVFDLFGAVMESFNPLGGNGRIDSMIMPTAFDPFNDLSKNEDWTGRNIAQEDFNQLDQTPGYTRTRDKATAASVELARWINNLSGGDDYEKGNLSPTGDQIEYLVGQVTGGVGREIVKSVTTIESIVTGEDLPMYKIPLAGRFVGSSEGQAPQAGKFYNNLAKINKINRGIEGRIKDDLDVDAYLEKNPEYQLIDFSKRADRAISKLKKYKRELVKEGGSRDEVKLVDEQITTIMIDFNSAVKEASESRQQ